MDDYNFLADLLATFRASPDFIKALWLIVPPFSALVMMGLMAWAVRLRMKPRPHIAPSAPRQHRALVLNHEDFDPQRIVGEEDSFSQLPVPRAVLDAAETHRIA